MKKIKKKAESGNDKRIDWDEVRRQLEASGVNNATLSSIEKSDVLTKRARDFAKENKDDETENEVIEIIEFQLASEKYGIASSFVREVYPLKDFTALPGTPPFVVGIINVRGQIISVINLKKFFNLPENGLGQLNQVIILQDNHLDFGILADAIIGSSAIPIKDIQPSPPTVSGIGMDYLRGVTGKNLIILNAENILNDEKIIVDNQVNRKL